MRDCNSWSCPRATLNYQVPWKFISGRFLYLSTYNPWAPIYLTLRQEEKKRYDATKPVFHTVKHFINHCLKIAIASLWWGRLALDQAICKTIGLIEIICFSVSSIYTHMNQIMRHTLSISFGISEITLLRHTLLCRTIQTHVSLVGCSLLLNWLQSQLCRRQHSLNAPVRITEHSCTYVSDRRRINRRHKTRRVIVDISVVEVPQPVTVRHVIEISWVCG